MMEFIKFRQLKTNNKLLVIYSNLKKTLHIQTFDFLIVLKQLYVIDM